MTSTRTSTSTSIDKDKPRSPRLFDTRNYAIDLETLALGPNAVVTAASLARFYPTAGPEHVKTWIIDPVAQQRDGRELDAETCVWWMQQPESARMSFAGDEAIAQRVHPFRFVSELRDIIAPLIPGEVDIASGKRYMDFTLWAKPQHFDIAILENLANQYKVPARSKVIHRRKVHNVRTAFEIINVLAPAGAPPMEEDKAAGDEHNPTADVMRTAKAMGEVLRAFTIIRGTMAQVWPLVYANE